jgi:hypothetical protein
MDCYFEGNLAKINLLGTFGLYVPNFLQICPVLRR